MLLRSALPWLALLALGPAVSRADAPTIDATLAHRYFEEAAQQCRADGGRLWGKSLCGPILLVEPASRRVVANQADGEGRLHAEGGVYVGRSEERRVGKECRSRGRPEHEERRDKR